MQKELIDLIIDYIFKIRYASYQDERTFKLALYQEAKNLYCSSPAEFDHCTLSLLEDHVPYLEEDANQAKLESSGIWHKNGFDTFVFRIRFHLNLSPEMDTQRLKEKIKAAYTAPYTDFMQQLDIRNPYKWLFVSVLKSDDSNDSALRTALEQILTPEVMATDVDGVISYVFLCKYLLKKSTVPAFMKTIYNATTHLAVIEGDGLHGWLTENKISTLKGLHTAVKKLGAKETATVLCDLYDYMTDGDKNLQSDEVIKAIDEFETKLMAIHDADKLMELAEAYRQVKAKNKFA